MLAAEEPPRYRRSPQGSKLDPFEAVIGQVLGEWPEIKAPRMAEILREHGYEGALRSKRDHAARRLQ